jgi:hypothetical protein
MSLEEKFMELKDYAEANNSDAFAIIYENGLMSGFINGNNKNMKLSILHFLRSMDDKGVEIFLHALFAYVQSIGLGEDK